MRERDLHESRRRHRGTTQAPREQVQVQRDRHWHHGSRRRWRKGQEHHGSRHRLRGNDRGTMGADTGAERGMDMGTRGADIGRSRRQFPGVDNGAE